MGAISRNLSRFRNELKGVAILWVVFFHAQLGLDGFLYQIQRIGYGGVDIFFFLSGFGLFRSLQNDQDLGRYLKRRAKRLLPSYLPFCLVWLMVMLPVYGGGIATSLRIAVSNLTMISFFADAELSINWYISAMFLSLCAAPVFYAILGKGDRFWFRAAGLIMVLVIGGASYIGHPQYMALSRLPVFVIGMIFASSEFERILNPKTSVVISGSFVLGLGLLFICLKHFPEMLNDYAMYWHPFVLITPGLCVGIAWMFSKLPPPIGKSFAALGKASFEIFLFNVWIEVLGKKYGMISSSLEWLIWSAAGIVVGYIYHGLVAELVLKRKK